MAGLAVVLAGCLSGCNDSLPGGSTAASELPQAVGWTEVYENRDCVTDVCLQQGGIHIDGDGNVGYGPANGPVTPAGFKLSLEEQAALVEAANRVASISLPGTLQCVSWSEAPTDAYVTVRLTTVDMSFNEASRLIFQVDPVLQNRCTHGDPAAAIALYEVLQPLVAKYLPVI